MKNKILTEHQIAFLKELGKNPVLAKQFYLSGGTALAGFYLHHRYSEDLDFFSESEIDTMTLTTFLKKIQKSLGFKKIDFQQSYNRNLFFLDYGDEILKTEFTFFPFPMIEKGPSFHGVKINSLIDIATNKLFTIYQRSHARDYIDLYCLCKSQKYTIKELIKLAKAKFDWHIDALQLGTQFIKAKKTKDLPRMLIPLNEKEWHTFFEKEAKKLKGRILDERIDQ